MKTKMKTILSVCMITLLLYACTKSDPPAPLDCMGIENGLSVADECGTCHQSYIYDVAPNSNHIPTYIDDTTGLELGATEIVVIAGSPEDIASNPNWNGGPLAAVDSCGDCHQSYVYDFVTHVPTYINDTTGLILGATEMIVIAGSPEDIASNPNWNTGCTE
jgi:hypothetical protein